MKETQMDQNEHKWFIERSEGFDLMVNKVGGETKRPHFQIPVDLKNTS